ncbi:MULTISPECIES: YgiQ family radical SAM protein [Butyricimonas]|uniref:YgiQ family radical SAM protein n=1 Tax=Butyricimonas TaxID=574697 RepID=UPI001D08B3A9|nr:MULTISPECIES: YgiQ family radical SAM protein [Butyricimonas]MCB6970849.1 YgiQ family radical SAM protein [Butyricimonas synergistica]MCG4517563.1 YgiQ family radical SAM protein [Butyricimonas sp. DFI.6.44]
MNYNIQQWLPTTKKEVEQRGWNSIDVILFSGDAYVDHPSFGAAVIGRLLESLGLKVAIVPQPNWQDDLRDFKKLGKPNLFFGISPGCMDSMVNHYTAAKRRRSDDAYTPGNRSGARPDMPTIVYTRILKELFPDTPVIIGGIEASLRRFTHYDYWKDTLKPSILFESQADMLVYGMGEKPLTELCQMLRRGIPFHSLTNIPQTCVLRDKEEKYATNKRWQTITLASHEECLTDKKKYATNFRYIEEESNSIHAAKLIQPIEDKLIIVNPPYPPMTTDEIDAVYDLPFTRLPHPKYKDKEIPAYNMIRHSITLHRGCFGGCAFCTISAHQGKFIASRSEQSVLREVQHVCEMPDFKGTISDLGGPSANMYAMRGKDLNICGLCKRPSCLHPTVCKNLNTDHSHLLQLYNKVRQEPRVKHCFIGSGIRYDLVMHRTGNREVDSTNREYLETVIKHHVSGRFKVAPEHSSDNVLHLMRKPSFKLFHELTARFNAINKKEHLKQQIIPYFISSHPGCNLVDMAELAIQTKELDFRLEQVQDFTPTPMTLATDMYYSGLHPYSSRKIQSAKTETEKKRQNIFFFWYKREFKDEIIGILTKLKRNDIVKRLYSNKNR